MAFFWRLAKQCFPNHAVLSNRTWKDSPLCNQNARTVEIPNNYIPRHPSWNTVSKKGRDKMTGLSWGKGGQTALITYSACQALYPARAWLLYVPPLDNWGCTRVGVTKWLFRAQIPQTHAKWFTFTAHAICWNLRNSQFGIYLSKSTGFSYLSCHLAFSQDFKKTSFSPSTRDYSCQTLFLCYLAHLGEICCVSFL